MVMDAVVKLRKTQWNEAGTRPLDERPAPPILGEEEVDNRECVEVALAPLSPRWRQAVELRYGLTIFEGGHTQLGTQMGVSAVRVRQLAQKGVNEIRKRMGVPA